jgi:hypothetical protein
MWPKHPVWLMSLWWTFFIAFLKGPGRFMPIQAWLLAKDVHDWHSAVEDRMSRLAREDEIKRSNHV